MRVVAHIYMMEMMNTAEKVPQLSIALIPTL